jgi:hypothetical protein
MTGTLTILSILGLIALCWMMAKYNKNDNLFWILLISLLAGMAGGAIFHNLSKAEENSANFEQVYIPTQVFQADGIGFYAEPGNTIAILANPVSKEIETPAFGIKISTAPSEVREEIRGQPFKPFDTS